MTVPTTTSQVTVEEPVPGIFVLSVPKEFEEMPEDLVHEAFERVLAPLRQRSELIRGAVMNLTALPFLGSVMISAHLKTHMLVKKHGQELVLCGVSERLRQLLHLTALDQLWTIYNTVPEAVAALQEE